MKIALGADHAGFRLKQHLATYLKAAGHQVVDAGTDSPESTDYPDYAARVARMVAAGETERGLLVCGTGVGMAMAANKVPGVRAACCNELYLAKMARAHNDANVLTLAGRVVAVELAEEIVRTFLETPFEGGRHSRRLEKIARLEAKPG